MIEMLRFPKVRRRRGRGQAKLAVEDQLLLVLEYWCKVWLLEASKSRALRKYRIQFHIATSWGLSESAVCRLIQRVERLLRDSRKFHLPGKKQLYQNAHNWDVVVVDVTESSTHASKKNSVLTERGKKKQHTLKAQVAVNQATGQILCTVFGKGRIHDFQLFKLCRTPMLPEQLWLADRGYQVITKLHPSNCNPTKKPRTAEVGQV